MFEMSDLTSYYQQIRSQEHVQYICTGQIVSMWCLSNMWGYNFTWTFSCFLASAGGTWPSCLWSSVICWQKSRQSSLEDNSKETRSGLPKLMLLTSGGDFLVKSKCHLSIIFVVVCLFFDRCVCYSLVQIGHAHK